MTTPYQARRLLDAWIGVGPPLDERPPRPEVKDWVRVGLNDWCRLRAENEALTAQRDDALEDLAAERVAHDADVVELGDHRDTLRGMLRQAQCERNRLRAELQERAKFSAGVGRAPCSCTPRGGEK